MPITIAPSPALDALTFCGDVFRSVPVSSGPLAIALSDGTLLEASLAAPPGKRFRIAREGAAIVVSTGDGVEIQWPIEWFTIAEATQVITIERTLEPLPLFPEAA